MSFLAEIEAGTAGKEETVLGYKVKVRYWSINEAERKARKQAVAKTILELMRKLKITE